MNSTSKNESSEPEVATQDNALTAEERKQLKVQEAVIAKGLTSAFEIGAALGLINTGRLYRQDYGTFEEYAAVRWDLRRAYAYQLIWAAKVRANLQQKFEVLPQNEFQTRAMTKLTPEQQVTAWEQVLEQAQDGRITNKIISGVVSDLVAAIEAPTTLALNATEVRPVTEQQYLYGDPLQILASLPAGCGDLVLISDLAGSTAESQAATLGDLLAAASDTAKEDHQALVFTTMPDYRPLLAVAEELGYEVGVPFHWVSNSEKRLIDWSARCCGQVVLHLRRGPGTVGRDHHQRDRVR